jgi:hypothetical protein
LSAFSQLCASHKTELCVGVFLGNGLKKSEEEAQKIVGRMTDLVKQAEVTSFAFLVEAGIEEVYLFPYVFSLSLSLCACVCVYAER